MGSPAMKRAQVLFFETKGRDIPEDAKRLVNILSKKVGGCSEVYITAFCHYAQHYEKLECDENDYRLDDYHRKLYNILDKWMFVC